MKDNAWRSIAPNDYDAHMSHPKIEQTQMLNRIFKEQFELLPQERRSASCVAILGITNGNGLEHVIPCEIAKIIGIDINEAFLNECKTRYPDIKSRLNLFLLDLMVDTSQSIEILSECDLIIANLLIKHIHLDNFIKIVAGLPKHGQIVSCVIQVNPDGVVVSQGSGFEHVFEVLSSQRGEENEDIIVASMNENGFIFTNKMVYDLPNGKQFIRVDFTAK